MLRGGLLAAMLAVHIAAAHATAAQASALHAWFGVFLISTGFVALSGYLVGAQSRGLTAAVAHKGFAVAVRLLLVMLAYGALVSLARHGLTALEGPPAACATRHGWVAPHRFESLGILLPIAIVQLFAPLVRARRGVLVIGLLALGFVLLPVVTHGVSAGGPWGTAVGILARRSVTPFYTVSTFVAIGLVGALLGRGHGRWSKWAPRRPSARATLIVAATLVAIPVAGNRVLDPVHLVSPLAGTLATLLWWTLVVGLLLAAAVAPPVRAPSRGIFGALGLMGRHSLLVFVLHTLLLELDTFVRGAAGIPKGLGVTAAFFTLNVVILVAAAIWTERSARARSAFAVLLVDVWSGRRGMGVARAVALAALLAAYSGAAFAGPDRPLVLEDADGPAECPNWWRFGELEITRSESGTERGRVLEVRGDAPGMFAHGMGTYLTEDIGDRRTLELDVRGYGPRSGRMKIELVEDDNGNWDIEKGPSSYVPEHDDRLVFEMTVDWTGWRHVKLPVSLFRDDNPQGGNNRFDPERELTSGGLLELQLLFAPAASGQDAVMLDLDNLRWSR